MRSIALINHFYNEYTTATYFREILENAQVPHACFTPEEQHLIPQEYDIHLYIDDGSHYALLPSPSAIKIIYIIDTHTSFEVDCCMCKRADYVFCAQHNAVERLKKFCLNTSWLPLACSPPHHSAKGKNFLYDVAFIGGINDPRRESFLKILEDKYRSRGYFGLAEKTEIGEIYSSSKIVFNVATNNDINMRFFEGLCSGALLITDEIFNNGLEELLQHSKEPICVFYKNIDDCLNKIDYYLLHDDERNLIAQNGKRFAANNTYEKRFQGLYVNSYKKQRNFSFLDTYIQNKEIIYFEQGFTPMLRQIVKDVTHLF